MALEIGIIIFLAVGIIFTVVVICKDKVHFLDDGTCILASDTNICPHCNNPVEWEDDDILIKRAPGNGYTVPCPHCGKLVHVYDRNE